MKRIFLMVAILTAFISCSKNNNDDGGGNTTVDVTVSTLMGSSGKRWQLGEINLTYYSAGGSIDSTRKFDALSTMYFGNNNGVNGIHLNFTAEYPLTAVFPGFGSWTLNQGARITMTCINPYCNGTNGDWQITSHRIITYNPLFESMNWERTVTLTAGRKVNQKVSFLIY